MRFLNKQPAQRRVFTRGWFDFGLAASEIEAEEIIPGTVVQWAGPVG